MHLLNSGVNSNQYETGPQFMYHCIPFRSTFGVQIIMKHICLVEFEECILVLVGFVSFCKKVYENKLLRHPHMVVFVRSE